MITMRLFEVGQKNAFEMSNSIVDYLTGQNFSTIESRAGICCL